MLVKYELFVLTKKGLTHVVTLNLVTLSSKGTRAALMNSSCGGHASNYYLHHDQPHSTL